jgi:aspartyl-tRNA(Asn)/glutamyl-tRNA(Gln) amidotransferase subunit A
MNIKALQQQLKNSQNGAEHYIQSRLEEIEHYQRTGGKAYISLNTESALNAAKSADYARNSGFVASDIAGLAVNIKDMFDVKDEVTTAGSKALQNNAVATQDAKAVQVLRHAGAVLVGRGNMSEFAFSGLGWNPHYGTPTYTENFQRIAGGSTSGGAVSVALKHCVAALGSDTGGSLRIPAAFCGIVGFKPSYGRISTDGAFPLSFSLDSIGAITQSVADAIIMDEILASTKHPIQNLHAQQLRLAYTDDYFLDQADDSVLKAWQDTLELLCKQGVYLEKIDLKVLYQIPKINHAGGLTAAEAWFIHRDQLQNPSQAEQYDQRVAQRIVRGQSISAADFLDIQQQRTTLINHVSHKLADFDAFLHPTVAIVPPKLSELSNDDDFFRINGLVLRNTSVFNFINGCALSLPCHQTSSLPVGLSVSGLHGQDTHILNVSLAIESILKQGENP